MPSYAEAIKVPKFVAHPDTRISGQALQAVFQSILWEEMQTYWAAVMERNGYESPEVAPDEWYPLQMYYDFCRELKANSGDTLILVSVGVKIIETAAFPPEIDSLAVAMQMLMDTHKLNLQNVPDTDRYHDLEISENKITFVEQTSFPHDIMYGYIVGLTRRFRADGTHPVVRRILLDEENPDADGARYEIVW